MSVKIVQQSGTGVPGYIGYILIALGAAALAQVAVVNGRIALFGKSAEGVIVKLEKTKPVRGSTIPVIRFESASGEVVVFRGFPQYRSPYEVGQVWPVRYVATDPSRAEIDSWPTLWRAILVATCLGLALLTGGIAIVRKTRARGRTSPG